MTLGDQEGLRGLLGEIGGKPKECHSNVVIGCATARPSSAFALDISQ